MKKIKIIQIIGITLFIIYIGLIISDILLNYMGDYKILTLSFILALVSINSIWKGVVLRSSSTLWFSITLILISITIVIFDLNALVVENYYFIFVLIPIIASLINLAIFHNLIYIKVIILNISIAIPTIIHYFYNLKVWWNILSFGVSIVLGIIICRLWNLDKENV